MSILDQFQKLDNLIIEHTQPPVRTVLRNQLALAREQVEAYQASSDKQDETLARQAEAIAELQKENDKFVTQKASEIFHRGIKFKRAAITGGRWSPFCPKCGLPVNDVTVPTGISRWALCSAHCGWVGVELDLKGGIDALIAEISS